MPNEDPLAVGWSATTKSPQQSPSCFRPPLTLSRRQFCISAQANTLVLSSYVPLGSTLSSPSPFLQAGAGWDRLMLEACQRGRWRRRGRRPPPLAECVEVVSLPPSPAECVEIAPLLLLLQVLGDDARLVGDEEHQVGLVLQVSAQAGGEGEEGGDADGRRRPRTQGQCTVPR